MGASRYAFQREPLHAQLKSLANELPFFVAFSVGPRHPLLPVSGRSVAWLARLFRVQEVVSSNLTAPTIFSTVRCTSFDVVLPLTSILQRIDPAKLFANSQLLEVELGSGDGSFLAAYAAQHPDRNFIGVERLLGRLRKLDRKGRQAGLGNLRAVRIESAYFLRYLLPPHSVSTLHIYFPDPWPKRKHRRHRLINDQFVQLAQAALVPGGTVFLRTDDRDYFEQMVSVFGASPGFSAEETPQDLAELLTDFEREFRARGIKTLRAAYRAVVPLPCA